MRNSFLLLLLCLLVTSCYYPHSDQRYESGLNLTCMADSLEFRTDLSVHKEGEMNLSTPPVVVRYSDPLVVSDVKILPDDPKDSIWVGVMTQTGEHGWMQKSDLLEGAVPDDPISRFIHYFSNNHLWAFGALLVLALVVWLVRKGRHHRFPVVHVDDIPSPFPMLLCLCLSGSAVLYASVQHFVPATWEYFYFHPTLNPFGLPLILALFLCSVWLMIILLGAALLDIYRCLRPVDAVLYTLSLGALLAFLYVIFSVLTLYYLGYPLLLAYVVWAVYRFVRYHRARYVCGRCGALLHRLGRCPKCGADNT